MALLRSTRICRASLLSRAGRVIQAGLSSGETGNGSGAPRRSIFGYGKAQSQSKVLGESSRVFELQVDNIKPDCMEEYLETAGQYLPQFSDQKDISATVLGGWTTEVGSNVDQATHLICYEGGYKTVDEVSAQLRSNKDFIEYHKKQQKLIASRSRQVLLAFSFWDPAGLEVTIPRGTFELRSYTLKPGTLIEWGQAWQQGIKYRKKEEAVGGWFSQIGDMHVVHHLWAYKSYVDRHETRQSAWHMPGWDECVRRTVRLIRHMEAKILIPTKYSPLQ